MITRYEQDETTRLLRQGDFDALMPRIYDELCRIARRRLRRFPDFDTLDTRALVHEAFLKLVGAEDIDWQSRQHFLAMAAKAMREVALNYARRKQAQKRGGGALRLSLNEAPELEAARRAERLLALDEALQRLEAVAARQARIVELRYFGGHTHAEVARLLGVSERTVKRQERLARLWLRHALDAEV